MRALKQDLLWFWKSYWWTLPSVFVSSLVLSGFACMFVSDPTVWATPAAFSKLLEACSLGLVASCGLTIMFALEYKPRVSFEEHVYQRYHSAKDTGRSEAKTAAPVRGSRECAGECDTAIARIQSLNGTLKASVTPVVQTQLDYIVDRCCKIQKAIVGDDKLHLAQQFLEQYVKPTEAWFVLYERLKSRDLDLAKGSIEDAEDTMLPLLSTKLNAFYNELHVADIAKLATADVAIELAKKAEVKLELEALV